MKYSLVILLLVFFNSATQAKQHRWDYMDIGFSDDGLGKGLTFSVASNMGDHMFARADIWRTKSKTLPSQSVICFLFTQRVSSMEYSILRLGLVSTMSVGMPVQVILDILASWGLVEAQIS